MDPKYDFAADSFTMKNFWGTEAAMNNVMLAFNLMSLIRHALMKHPDLQHSGPRFNTRHKRCTTNSSLNPRSSRPEEGKLVLSAAIAMQQRA